MDITVKGRTYPVKVLSNGCWELLGSKGERSERGYARVRTASGRRLRVGRELMNCPAHLVVCHTCDHPPCVNPDHLWVGTQQENMRDMVRKGRGKPCTKVRKAGGVWPSKELAYRTVIQNPNMHYAELAKLAGVSITTVYSWRKVSR